MSVREWFFGMLLIGCSASADPFPNNMDTSSAGGTESNVGNAGLYPCEVGAILQSKCWSCHGDQTAYGAPMSMTSWGSLQNSTVDGAESILERMEARITDGTMPPPTWQPQLTPSEAAVLQNWIQQGAPSGSACEPPPVTGTGGNVGQGGASSTGGGTSTGGAYYGTGGSPQGGAANGGAGGLIGQGGGTTVFPPEDIPVEPDASECDFIDVTARADASGAPYNVPSGEQYYCFGYHLDLEQGAQALAFYPQVDNTAVIHHWLLYKMTTPQTNGFVSACLGTHQDGELLAGWTPGANPWFLPAHVGMELGSGDFILEVHYFNTGAPTQDASGVRVCKAKEHRPTTAGISWLGTEAIFIPPLVQGFAVPSNCSPPLSEPVHILTTWPHMHGLGSRMTATVTRAGGAVEPMFDFPFDFDYQRQWDIPTVINPGDSIQTTCFYDNDTSNFVGFGESTTTEMCYNFIVAYPANTLKVPGLLHSTSCNN